MIYKQLLGQHLGQHSNTSNLNVGTMLDRMGQNGTKLGTCPKGNGTTLGQRGTT
jgi:hypothetical protein